MITVKAGKSDPEFDSRANNGLSMTEDLYNAEIVMKVAKLDIPNNKDLDFWKN